MFFTVPLAPWGTGNVEGGFSISENAKEETVKNYILKCPKHLEHSERLINTLSKVVNWQRNCHLFRNNVTRCDSAKGCLLYLYSNQKKNILQYSNRSICCLVKKAMTTAQQQRTDLHLLYWPLDVSTLQQHSPVHTMFISVYPQHDL